MIFAEFTTAVMKEEIAEAAQRSCNPRNTNNVRNVNDNGNPRNNDNAYNRNNGFAADCEKLGPLKVARRTALQNQCHFYKEQSSLPRIFSEVKTMPVTSSAYELVRLSAPA